ncbi:hypothetical protein PGTUg99_004803 [Puccinia graminis f. sp. tritici]|uniref:Uncharacterized protein n=1 Tax=Puccinia graminis f. sp. tritici TaxID=56615 RepID=A0A5B0RJT6_PUCGR|nr:hypothetical protein PGTUg99_004803 [Puccinia graminis f. sp. tritici]
MRQRLTLLILYYVKAVNSMAQPEPLGLSHAVNEAEEVPVATMAVDRSAMSSHNPLSPKSSTPGTSQMLDSQTTQEDKTGQIDTITWPVNESPPHEVPDKRENKPPGSLESNRATDHAEEGNSRTKLNFIQKPTLCFTTGNPVPAATTGVHRGTMNSDNPLSPKSSVPGVSDQISRNAQQENNGRVDPIQWPVTEKPSEVPEERKFYT